MVCGGKIVFETLMIFRWFGCTLTLNIKNHVDNVTVQAVIDYAVNQPAHGQHRNQAILSNLR